MMYWNVSGWIGCIPWTRSWLVSNYNLTYKPKNIDQNFENPLEMLQKCKKNIRERHFWGYFRTFWLEGTGRCARRTFKLPSSWSWNAYKLNFFAKVQNFSFKTHKIAKNVKNVIFEDPLEHFDWNVQEGLHLEVQKSNQF
jgi:hypothetical protein